MAECRIPGHITGLYIFAVVNLCAMLNISLVSADVYVIDINQNSTIDTIEDRQAMFGPDLPEDGLVGRLIYVVPHDACHGVAPPPAEVGLPWIALIARGPCHFDQKVLSVQKAGFSAAIVHNYDGSDSLIPMGGDSSYADQVHIPSVFVGYTDGMALAHRYNYTLKSVVIKIEEPTERPPATYFLPFIVVVSICFIGVVAFSIIKCVKYFQHIRRTRLSKAALKKIPTRKYRKGDHYDTCAICLEDYEEGEKLRVLPCNHTYHCKCVDPWLTKRKKTCPQCKRRVIPGQETDSDSDGEEEGASESTPLLGNNNNRRPAAPGRRSRPTPSEASGGSSGSQSLNRSSAFEQSGLPAEVQPEVVVINEGQGTINTAALRAVAKEEGDTSDTTDEEEELEGAVGGVGISDRKDFEDITNVIIEVEPTRHSPTPVVAEAISEPADGDITTPEQILEERCSPARDEGSINGAFTASGSSEEDGGSSSSGSTAGRSGKKKKQRGNNQVV